MGQMSFLGGQCRVVEHFLELKELTQDLGERLDGETNTNLDEGMFDNVERVCRLSGCLLLQCCYELLETRLKWKGLRPEVDLMGGVFPPFRSIHKRVMKVMFLEELFDLGNIVDPLSVKSRKILGNLGLIETFLENARHTRIHSTHLLWHLLLEIPVKRILCGCT